MSLVKTTGAWTCATSVPGDKILAIKSSIPQVNRDSMKHLKKAFNRWIPLGGTPKFELKSVTENEVKAMIDKVKTSHAFGRDQIYSSKIKLGAPYLIPAITHTINLSLGTGHFPAKWKLARVLPLLKGLECDKMNPSSFRPISLLPIISKLSERAVQAQLLNYLETTIEDNSCRNEVHSKQDSLFSQNCENCGNMTMFADDSLYRVSSNNRDSNQDSIEHNFWKIKDYLNSLGLQVSEKKTKLTEYMTHQKRSKSKGIPPDLTIREEVRSRTGRLTLEDKLISDSPVCRMLGMNLSNSLTWDSHLSTGTKQRRPSCSKARKARA